MQEKEFNNLIDGKPAKWAEMFDPQNELMQLKSKLSLSEKEPRLTLIPGESKAKQRAQIKAAEKPIPSHIIDAIHKFIKEERAKKISERAIRRAVKRKWNIYVV